MAFNFNNLNLSNVQFSSGSSVIPVGDHVVSVTGATGAVVTIGHWTTGHGTLSSSTALVPGSTDLRL